jgi:AcrR family transcriptional regulator
MSTETRPYRKKARAAQEAETRQRITESAVALHEALGPGRTPMSAVAEHAGVRRSTLYRHFPDEAALFEACTSHWMADNPPPDMPAWAAIKDPDERLRVALGELYAYYGRTERMMSNLYRDEETNENVRNHFSGFRGFLAASRDVLMQGRGLRGNVKRRTHATIGHALDFLTWRSLVREQGLSDEEAVELACRLVTEAGRSKAGQSSSAASAASTSSRASSTA